MASEEARIMQLSRHYLRLIESVFKELYKLVSLLSLFRTSAYLHSMPATIKAATSVAHMQVILRNIGKNALLLSVLKMHTNKPHCRQQKGAI